VVKVLTFGTDA